VTRAWHDLTDSVAAKRNEYIDVDRRIAAESTPLVADVAVQVVDLRSASAHHVLKQRGPSAAPARASRGDVRLDLGEPAAFVRVDEPLRRDAVDRLDLVAAGPSDLHDFAAHVDRDQPRLRTSAHLGGPETGEPGQRIRHAV